MLHPMPLLSYCTVHCVTSASTWSQHMILPHARRLRQAGIQKPTQAATAYVRQSWLAPDTNPECCPCRPYVIFTSLSCHSVLDQPLATVYSHGWKPCHCDCLPQACFSLTLYSSSCGVRANLYLYTRARDDCIMLHVMSHVTWASDMSPDVLAHKDLVWSRQQHPGCCM